MRICKVDGCGRKHFGHGFCNGHYINNVRHGSPLVMNTRGADLITTLMARIPEKPAEGCWEWGGTRDNAGYGRLKWNGVNSAAHRLMFNAAHGYYPAEVRHRCDNPPCVRPDHLEGGGRQDNVDDRVNRGRSARLPGRTNPNARYTPEQVQAVLALKGTDTGDNVAAALGVNRNFVYRVWGGQS